MKSKERKEEKKLVLKNWKKPELKILDKEKTNSGGFTGLAEDTIYDSPQ